MRAAFTLFAALLLAACGWLGDSGKVYPMSGKDARQALLFSEPPLHLFGDSIASAHATAVGDGSIRWALADESGTSMLYLVATTKDEGPQQVRINVSVEPPLGAHHDAVAERLGQYPAVVNFFRAVLSEQVDSTLTHRDFDLAAVQGQMAAAALSLAPQMAESFDKAAKQYEADDRANIEGAYAHEGESESYDESDDSDFGKPMDPATGAAVD
jgi:hypothetical protein